MDSSLFNAIITKNVAVLKQEENTAVFSLVKLQKYALDALSKCETKLSALNKFEGNAITKTLYAKGRKEVLSRQLQEVLSCKEKDDQVINLGLHEKDLLQKRLEELRRKKEELTNNKEQTNGQKNSIDHLKKCIKACKILTKTHFDFGSSVCGYTLDQDFNYKCFEFEHQEDQNKVTEYLWNNLPTK